MIATWPVARQHFLGALAAPRVWCTYDVAASVGTVMACGRLLGAVWGALELVIFFAVVKVSAGVLAGLSSEGGHTTVLRVPQVRLKAAPALAPPPAGHAASLVLLRTPRRWPPTATAPCPAGSTDASTSATAAAGGECRTTFLRQLLPRGAAAGGGLLPAWCTPCWSSPCAARTGGSASTTWARPHVPIPSAAGNGPQDAREERRPENERLKRAGGHSPSLAQHGRRGGRGGGRGRHGHQTRLGGGGREHPHSCRQTKPGLGGGGGGQRELSSSSTDRDLLGRRPTGRAPGPLPEASKQSG
ncbi:unnamed protein product [Boreogadus saida]